MSRRIPAYVVSRICQKPSLPCIVEGSTPVIAFGDPWKCHAATLGLNPSRFEFLSSQGNLLDGDGRRLATFGSLGVAQISDAHAEQVVEDCAGYFQRAPYGRWFNLLEPLLKAMGASYYDGTACHLDLVQWATDPTWRKLPPAYRRRLLEEDVPFLVKMLREVNIRVLLLNGISVVRQFQTSLGVVLEKQSPLEDCGHQSCQVFAGLLFGSIRVVGWSTNIQSSWGVTSERRRQLALRISKLANPVARKTKSR